jgi:hypothetical protein
MKIFWSWQSDTPGKTGRHFVRHALDEAIEALKVPTEVEEPSAGEAREALHVDQDRQGVPGSPPLATTIFGKIEKATVFVADVTLVGQTSAGKKLINSNVAIEYGYAEHALGDTAILMVQNRFYGDRDALPFDLKHKAGPIQYSLAPDATPQQIKTEHARMRGTLTTALRPYLDQASASKPSTPFPETPVGPSPAVFFGIDEVLARVGVKGVDEIEYRFAERSAFYLRLIPTRARAEPLKFAELDDLANKRQLDTLTRQRYVGLAARNRFGAITIESSGTSPTPRAFTQSFRNGELWSVTTEFFVHHKGMVLIPMTNVKNICERVLANFCAAARDAFGIAPPYTIELGAIGLTGVHLGFKLYEISNDSILIDEIKVRRVLNEVSDPALEKLIFEFLDELLDSVGLDRTS